MNIAQSIGALGLFLSVVSFAGTPPVELRFGEVASGYPWRTAPVCERKGSVLIDLFQNLDMRLASGNDGGLAGGGFCWWHSRFQRAAWLLTEFFPNEPRPTPEEGRALIEAIIRMDHVVRIPGYANLYDFTKEHWPSVHKELNQWQARDAFIGQAWARGLMRKANFEKNPKRALKHIEKLFADYLADRGKGRVTWFKLQKVGFAAHSGLLIDMQRTSADSYSLTVIDSNDPTGTQHWAFFAGQGSISTGASKYDPAMAYAGYEKDSKKLESAVAEYCNGAAN